LSGGDLRTAYLRGLAAAARPARWSRLAPWLCITT